MKAISDFGPIEVLLLLGGIAGGFQAIRTAWRWVRHKFEDIPVTLEYEAVQASVKAHAGFVRNVSARVTVTNPNNFAVRITPLRVHTTFNGLSLDTAPNDKYMDLAPGLAGCTIHGADVAIEPIEVGYPIYGRLDWIIGYRRISKDKRQFRLNKLLLRGALDVFWSGNKPENRWTPDEGIETPIIDPSRSTLLDNGDFYVQDS